jgi:hypothetical protein
MWPLALSAVLLTTKSYVMLIAVMTVVLARRGVRRSAVEKVRRDAVHASWDAQFVARSTASGTGARSSSCARSVVEQTGAGCEWCWEIATRRRHGAKWRAAGSA